jgi:hypothetical protein
MESENQKKYEFLVMPTLVFAILLISICGYIYINNDNKSDKKYKVNVEYLGLNSLVYSYDCDSVSKGYAFKDGVKIQLQPESKITFK